MSEAIVRDDYAIIPLQRGEGKEPNYWGTYKEHQIHISRESRKTDWYIWVYAPCGSLCYDGYWKDSEGKTIRQAVREAIRGACIDENPETGHVHPETGHPPQPQTPEPQQNPLGTDAAS